MAFRNNVNPRPNRKEFRSNDIQAMSHKSCFVLFFTQGPQKHVNQLFAKSNEKKLEFNLKTIEIIYVKEGVSQLQVNRAKAEIKTAARQELKLKFQNKKLMLITEQDIFKATMSGGRVFDTELFIKSGKCM